MEFEVAKAALAERGMDLSYEQPFWALLFTSINRKIDLDLKAPIQWIEKEGSLILGVQPARWNSLNEQQQIDLILHELGHFVLGHPLQAKLFDNPFLFNLSADLILGKLGLSPLRVYFSNILPDSLELEAIYAVLEDAWDKQNPLLLGLFAESTALFESHFYWTEISGTDMVDIDRKATLGRALRQSDDQMLATLPTSLQTTISAQNDTQLNQVDWRKILRFFGHSARKTRFISTIKRTSKRYGTTPGFKVRRYSKLLVAIDTSGSISEAELGRFFGELHAIWKSGAILEIVECDLSIRRQYLYKGELPERVMGRTGTSFYPVFDFAASRPEFDGIIYFTDGKGAHPGKVPKIPLLWVLSARGRSAKEMENLDFPGRFIQMKN